MSSMHRSICMHRGKGRGGGGGVQLHKLHTGRYQFLQSGGYDALHMRTGPQSVHWRVQSFSFHLFWRHIFTNSQSLRQPRSGEAHLCLLFGGKGGGKGLAVVFRSGVWRRKPKQSHDKGAYLFVRQRQAAQNNCYRHAGRERSCQPALRCPACYPAMPLCPACYAFLGRPWWCRGQADRGGFGPRQRAPSWWRSSGSAPCPGRRLAL